MRNRLVATNIAIKTFGGFALSQETTKTTSWTTRARPKPSQGCDWLKGYSGIQEYNTEELAQYTEYKIGFFSQWSQFFRTSIDALSFGGHENQNYNIWWLGYSAKTIKQRRRARTVLWWPGLAEEWIRSDFFLLTIFLFIKFWVDAYRSMYNFLVVTNVAIKTFGGFTLSWKNFRKTNKMRPRQTNCD